MKAEWHRFDEQWPEFAIEYDLWLYRPKWVPQCMRNIEFRFSAYKPNGERNLGGVAYIWGNGLPTHWAYLERPDPPEVTE